MSAKSIWPLRFSQLRYGRLVERSALLLFIFCIFGLARVAAHAEIRIIGRTLVSVSRTSSTEFGYTYRLQVQNLGAAATQITAVATSFAPDLCISQGKLYFPDIPAGGTASSTNTYSFMIRESHQLLEPPNQSLIRFAFSAISTPVADAGPDQLITVLNHSYDGQAGPYCCKISGGGSYDPFGQPLTYTWTVISAPSGSHPTSWSSGVNFDIVPDLPGDYVISLVVNNGYHNSAPSYVRLSTVAVAPRADAGYNQTIKPGQTVQLDGSHSVNPMNRPLTYAWSFVSVPSGSHPSLSDPASPRPTFVAAPPGGASPQSYTLQLVVKDGARTSAPATVTYTTGNTPPRADAGPTMHIAFNSYGFLSANRSTDVNGDFLTYRWAVLSKPYGTTVLDPVPNPDFKVNQQTLSDVSLYHIELFVNDGYSESIATQVVSGEGLEPVLPITPYSSVLPAIATVDPPAPSGTITLDGSLTQTSDTIDAEYWNLREAPSGSTATLTGNGMTATITPDEEGLYIAQFQTDAYGFVNYPTAVSFLKHGGLPVAKPGSTQFGLWTGRTVHRLNGSSSYDPEGRQLTYHWSLLSKPLGSEAVLFGATSVSPTFTADKDGTYIFQLVVNNGLADSAPATVSIISKDSVAPTAIDLSVLSPWKSPCVPVSLHANDPLLDPYQYGGEIKSVPNNGFLGEFLGGSIPTILYAWGTQGTPANNPEGRIGAKTICYIPFYSTWTGLDTFTYTVWDMGYPSGCKTPGNYCIAPKESATATVSIHVVED